MWRTNEIHAPFRKNRVEKMWGQRATHVDFNVEHAERLPSHCIAVWLNSFEPIEDGCGSELVLVGFTDFDKFEIPRDIEEWAARVDWNTLASDWGALTFR